jgi:replicative DNA helicase
LDDATTFGGLYSQRIEEDVLGALFISPGFLPEILTKTKLRPNDFYFDRNKVIYQIILQMHDEGVPCTEDLVVSTMNGQVPKGYVATLAANVAAPGNVIHYAKKLVELHRWRERRRAAQAALEASNHKDEDAFTRASLLIDNDEIKEGSLKTPEKLAADFKEFMEEEKVDAIPLPFEKFNRYMGGGLHRKQMTVLGGWTSHGKSVIIDQFLEHFAKQGFSCHLYINEMSEEDRLARSICRDTGIAYQRLVQHQTTNEEKQEIRKSLKNGCPYFCITPCAGWSISELAYDIKSRAFDVVGIDILHLFDYDSEIELSRISRLLNRTAKQANCHIIATVHLNEFRADSVVRPRPITRDIRGSGMLKNDADNVMFIYRNQDSYTGDPLTWGLLYTAKVRNGIINHVPVMFMQDRFEFMESEYPEDDKQRPI